MKRFILLGLLCVVFAVPVHAAEIFWDGNPPPDAEITDKDFTFKYPDPIRDKDPSQPEIYDSGELPDLGPGLDEAERQPAPAPREPRTIERPRSPEPPTVAPAPRRRPATVEPRRGQGEGNSLEKDLQRIKPSVEQPVVNPKSDFPSVDTKPGSPVPVTGQDEPKAEPKKLPWGKDEPPTAEPQTKFPWGQKK
ncbi:MAG: hypothetical protein HY914_01560 [Desulfomonile tiedjei]|nr:hypothetical protein [Desulfomonile tiedjei]